MDRAPPFVISARSARSTHEAFQIFSRTTSTGTDLETMS